MPSTAEHRAVNLPLFDISDNTLGLGNSIVDAAVQYGFFWVDGSQAYGLDGAAVDNAFGISRRFFTEASASDKEECRITHNRGFVGMHVETLDPQNHARGDFKQAFNLEEPDRDTQIWKQQLPRQFREYDPALRDFHAKCRSVAERILILIANGLGIEDSAWFVDRHDKSPNTARFLFYPALPQDADYDEARDIRAGAHSDYGSITLLFTRPNQPGLEILGKENEWASVPVFPPNYHSDSFPPILVNIGDLLSYWTNGLLKSTIHRVVLMNPDSQGANGYSNNSAGIGTDRFSIAVFVQPNDDTELIPCPSPVLEANPKFDNGEQIGRGGGIVSSNEMEKLTAGEYLSNRLKSTYGSVYEPEKKK